VAFNIKTTAPKKYVVRPSSGIAEAGSNVSLQVIMQAQKEYPSEDCRDKFMIQVTPLKSWEEIDSATFDRNTRRDLHEHRLRVVMEEGPAADSPSPVRQNFGAPAGESISVMAASPAACPACQALRMQLDRVKREREDLRKKLVGLLGGGGLVPVEHKHVHNRTHSRLASYRLELWRKGPCWRSP